jgi:ectoine hydroxylase-related dioxygenase (phytanoyl-CoA dioxygenase family)
MLTQQQADQYRRDGFTVYPGFLSRKDIDSFLGAVESITQGNTLANHDKTRMEMEPDQPPNGTMVRRLYEPCTHYPIFRDFAESATLLDCVEQLLGPNVVFHYSKLNMKPAAIGSVVEWHQDLAYYPLSNCDSLAVLLYLDDADQHNGCLRIITGRHLVRLMDHTRDGFFQGKITVPVPESQAVSVEGLAGTAIFMHSMAPHSSAPNRSLHPRRTLILSYRAADAYPIYIGEETIGVEANARLVRGSAQAEARFTLTSFPIPKRRWKTASLYELQERSREQTGGHKG